MRSIADYGMGVLFLLIGLYFLLNEVLGITIAKSGSDAYDKVIGVLFVLYGSWRIYRGYKKNYFR